jgi:olfactory receptor
MEARNKTAISKFVLLGMTDDLRLQPLLFNLFLSIYLNTIMGNLLIILTISSDACFHTPMHFFLYNLFLNDMFQQVRVPKMLMYIQRQDHRIIQAECLSQVYFVIICIALEIFLLAAMAYDHYGDICYPLRSLQAPTSVVYF